MVDKPSYANKYVLRVTVVGLILNFIGVCLVSFFGYVQFIQQQKILKRIEFDRHVWERKISKYETSCNVVGELLSSVRTDTVNKTKFFNAKDKFFDMYWGEIKLLAGDSVIYKLETLRHEIEHFNLLEFDKSPYQIQKLTHLKAAGLEFIESCKKDTRNELQSLTK